MRFSSRRLSASSRSHGQLVVARTITLAPSALLVSPSICVSSSAFILRLASCSLSPPLAVINASTSSMKTMEGARWRASANKQCTRRSLSPRHFEMSVEALQLKNVDPFMPATALASIVLPVPGGPNSRTPFHGSRIPVKNSGTSSGSATASFSSRLASASDAMSAKVTPSSASITSRSIARASAGSASGGMEPAAGAGGAAAAGAAAAAAAEAGEVEVEGVRGARWECGWRRTGDGGTRDAPAPIVGAATDADALCGAAPLPPPAGVTTQFFTIVFPRAAATPTPPARDSSLFPTRASVITGSPSASSERRLPLACTSTVTNAFGCSRASTAVHSVSAARPLARRRSTRQLRAPASPTSAR
mmetsp:Transcript_16359/g.51995  ORF Transcript_16359/g.51995 Transcript_16359/m.51995 type:complete len:362 (+) Transcript_16359:415-1500(+)